MEASAAAKSQLNQFYQRCKSPLPRYDVKKAEGGFKCTIVCPSVYTEEGSVELQIFTGKGANKNASQAAAAAEAVKFLQRQPLFAVKKPFVESLWETVKSSLSDQVHIVAVCDDMPPHCRQMFLIACPWTDQSALQCPKFRFVANTRKDEVTL